MRSAVLLLVGGAVATGAALTSGGADAARSLLGPAHDAVTVSSLRNLGTALQSYVLVEGGADGVSVDGLADWGWTPQPTTAATVRVADDGVTVVARDVRPGSTTYRLTVDDDGVVSLVRVGAGVAAESGLPLGAAAGVAVGGGLTR